MTNWLETAKAIIVGVVSHPKETTVILQDERTGRITTREMPPKHAPKGSAAHGHSA